MLKYTFKKHYQCTQFVINPKTKSDKKIYIQGFTYDGEGPDAFFLAGESGTRPNARATNGKTFY